MLSTSAYLLGVVELALLSAAALLGARALRARLLRGWTGSPAWLATTVIAIALILWVAQLLGAVGLFREGPLIAAVVLLGAGLWLWLGRRPGEPRAEAVLPAPDPGTPARIAGIVVAAVAIAHFTIGVRLRLSTGMTGFDSTWYHGPFAAAFAQSGNTFDIHFIAPQFLTWFYPQSSELLHAVGMVAFDRDLISPLLNLGWLCGCLAAAWCIGRPYGAAPLSMAGVAVVLDSGALADQAGEARNDLAATFFLLAAVAIALNAWSLRGQRGLGPGSLAVAGLAAGLSAGTRLNFLAAAVALVAGLIALCPAGERRRALWWAGAPALAGAGYWYLRNLVHAGSPLPWLRDLGPIQLPAPDQPLGGREGHSVLGYLGDGSIWSEWFLPGLHSGLGTLWPVLVLTAALGLGLGLGRRSDPMLRVSAAVGVLLLISWLVAPTSASGPEGDPRGFLSGLRYLAPALALGMALLPLSAPVRERGLGWAVLALAVLLLPFVDASGEPWHSAYLAAALAAGVVAAGVAIALGSPRVRRLPRSRLAAAALAVLLIVVAAGERGQRSYLRNRYADPQFTVPGLNAAFRWARGVTEADIATTGTRQYPLFGTDLSNEVQFVGIERPHAGFVAPQTCRAWRRALTSGHYDYAVATRDRLQPGEPPFPPQARWTAADPDAEVVLRKAPTVVFRLDGPLDPEGCRSPPGSR